MEVQLNEYTIVEVTAKLSKFRVMKKDKQDFLYVRNDKVYGAQVTTHKWFCTKLFVIALFVAIFGGYAHFAYDTMVLGYEPNPGIIFGIFFVITVIGFFVSFRKRRVLELVVDSNTSQKTFVFPIGKETSEKQVEDLVDILVN